MTPRTAFLVLAWLALAAAPRADVIVVDPAGGPGGGALLQAALDAAQTGDILLLRDGDYTDMAVGVQGKAVAIVAEAGASVTLPRLTADFPPEDGTLLLRGLRLEPAVLDSASGRALFIQNGFGGFDSACWIEDCEALGATSDPDGPGGTPAFGAAAAVIIGMRRVTLVRSTARGGDGPDATAGPPAEAAGDGGEGLLMALSGSTIQECVLSGGHGGDGAYDAQYPPHGRAGADVAGSTPTALLGCVVQGGDEGEGNDAAVWSGPGLKLGNVQVTLRDTLVAAGEVHGAGTASPPVVLESGAGTTSYPAPARSLVAPAVAREGQAIVLSFRGVPGDGAWACAATEAGLKKAPACQGHIVLLDPLPTALFAGPITDPAGTLELALTMPDLPPGTAGLVIFLQSVMAPPEGGLLLGSGSALAWIDGTL